MRREINKLLAWRERSRDYPNALNLSAESRGVTRSTMERRFLAFARRHGLPAPELNYRIELPGRTVFADCAWPTYRLIVELDSRAAHALLAEIKILAA